MAVDQDDPPRKTGEGDLLHPLRPAAPPAAVDAEKIDRLLEIGTDLQQLVNGHLLPDTLPAREAHACVLAAIEKLKAATDTHAASAKAHYGALKEAVARLPATDESRRRDEPADVRAEAEARDRERKRLEESAALFLEVVGSLGKVRDDLEAAVQRIQRPGAAPAQPGATGTPTPASLATIEAAGGIPQAWVAEFARIDRLAARIADLENAQRTLTDSVSGGFDSVRETLDAHDDRVKALHPAFQLVRNALSNLAGDARKAAEQSRNLRHFRVSLPVIVLAIVAGMLLENEAALIFRLFR